MSPLVRLASVGALGCFALGLSGYKLIDPPRKYKESTFPVEYVIGNDGGGDLAPAGLNRDDAVSLIEAGYAAWEDARCSPITTSNEGDVTNDPTFNRSDRDQLMFEGNLESGVLAATVTHGSNTGLSYNGVNFNQTSAMNIIYNSGITWGNPQTISDPSCRGRTSYLGVTTHEIGHGFGFGHSCDSGEPCPDPILRAATMYWSVGSCDPNQDTINADDVNAVNAVYGVAVDFDLAFDTEQTVGTVPVGVTVSIPDEYQSDRYTEFTWNFGDGSDLIVVDNDGTPNPQDHTYTEEGQFTITLTAVVDDPDCGGLVETQRRKVGAVLACGEPAPSFAWENKGGLEIELRNTSSLDAFGCVTDFEWIIDDETTLRTYEPVLVFETPGEHDVTLRASGFGGSAEVSQTVVARRAEPSAASCTLGGSGGGLLGLLLLGLLRRRD
jgi:hypothetical protein